MIGMFDSGIGGLSVWQELSKQLPNESILYVADQAHCPYGPRNISHISERSDSICQFLIEQGAQLIVIACNTATSAAAATLRNKHPNIPIVGMEPAIKMAAMHSQSGHVGVLATPATLNGDKFLHLKNQFDGKVTIHPVPGEGFVEVVERGDLDSIEAHAVIRKQLAFLQHSEIDHLVLGCTHYPFLLKAIKHYISGSVKITDPTEAVCRQIIRKLNEYGATDYQETPKYQFVTTGNPDRMSYFLRKVLHLDYEVQHATI